MGLGPEANQGSDCQDHLLEVCPRMFHCIMVCRAYSQEVAAH